jgi:hypothetical protein
MTPRFILPAGYQTRTVEFSLSRDHRGWYFVGRHDGYQVPARNPAGTLPIGHFRRMLDAHEFARVHRLPAYAVWNGRHRRYIGKGAEFIARARDAQNQGN